jgi:hypothetical protein
VSVVKHVIIGNSAAAIGAVEGIRHMDRQAGIPAAVWAHNSHFCTAPSSEGDTAPYGQLRMQV